MYIITGSTGLTGLSACEFYFNKKKTIIGINKDLKKSLKKMITHEM